MVQSILKIEQQYTFEEYCELEEQQNQKYEFHNGKIIPMPGGTINHGLVIGSLNSILLVERRKLDTKIFILNSEIKVYIDAIDEGLYPDASIVIGKIERYQKNKAITNPTVIFEVLSDSTGNYDRGKKFRKYKNLPSFQEYVLIEQDQPIVDVFTKKENNTWEMRSYIGLKDTLILSTIDLKIPLAAIYEDVADDLHLPQYKIDLS